MALADIWAELEPVQRRTRAPALTPEVTVQKTASFGLNAAALEALGRPSHVRLMFRRSPPLLGIRPSEADPDAYVVQDNGLGAVVNARAAVLKLGIDHSVARRYTAEVVEGGGLLIDFTQAGLVVSPRQDEDA